MGLFNVNRNSFESNNSVSDNAELEPVAANVGQLAVKVEVQDLDVPSTPQVVSGVQLQEIEDFANKDALAEDAMDQYAMDDFIDQSNGH